MRNSKVFKNSYPLMKNNITRSDLNILIKYLKKDDPKLTNGQNVLKFENLWSEWLGVKYSVFVNSGSSANLISLAILKEIYPNGGNIIVPAFTWVSDIASIIQNGFIPKFVDINIHNLAMNDNLIFEMIDSNTKAVFLTHAQGFNGLSKKLLNYLKTKKIRLIEDVCESHGATFGKKKCGTYGWISNFSFYYAHHISTIEGGMVCTNDEEVYEKIRLFRSHGLLREIKNSDIVNQVIKENPLLNPQFIFMYPAYNLRSTEINAIIGINQLKRLDKVIEKRNKNQNLFYKFLNKDKFYTNFNFKGSSNYAFNIILRNKDNILMKNLCDVLFKNKIEFRVGSAGGGNQLRQPYIKKLNLNIKPESLPITDHIHFYGMYIGNYPELNDKDIMYLLNIINSA